MTGPFPDPGIVSDVYHFSRRGSFEAKHRGESDHTFKMVMAASLIFMGARMAFDTWNKMHPPIGKAR